MSVRVQRYENLIKKWASLVSFRVRHFDKFENGIVGAFGLDLVGRGARFVLFV